MGRSQSRTDQDRETRDEPRSTKPTNSAESADQKFGTWDWLLVGLVIVAFLVVPWAIIISPPSGLPFLVAYLALPFLMAIVLATVAVWTAVS